MRSIRVDVCQECGRHAFLRGCDGRKFSPYFFSQNAGIELIRDLCKDRNISLETFWKLHDAIRASVLPVSTPDWMGELLDFDSGIDETAGTVYGSEGEVIEDFHDFLQALFPVRLSVQ